MSSLRRSIHGVVQVILHQLRRAAMAEGPEGMWLLENADVTADYVAGESRVRIGLCFKNKEIWRRELPLSREQIERSMSDQQFQESISTTMKAHLNLVAQMHFARLDQMFPNSILDVVMGYSHEIAAKTIVVRFKNGHVADGPESEAKGEFFLAKCAMLYDLPPI